MRNALNKIIGENWFFGLSVLLCFLVYFKFLFAGHISWDDPEMVFKNRFVRSFNLNGLFTHHFVGNYIPVTMFFHSLSWLFFGDFEGGHHLVNILLHLINGILIFSLGKMLFRNNQVAGFGAMVFLLHPLQIESVAWISELKNVLSTTFYLFGLIAYCRFTENKAKKYYWACLLFFVLGLLSKPSLVAFPLGLISLDLILNKQFQLKTLINKLPFFVLSFLFGWINIQTQTADHFINFSHEFPFYQRLGYAGFALIKYLALFLLPVNLSVIYPYPPSSWLTFGMGYLVIIFILVLMFWFIKKKQFQYLGLLLFILVNLVLVLQFIPFGDVLYADRYAYVPIIGLSWLFGKLFSNFKFGFKQVFLLLAGLLAFVTFSRVQVWKTALSLYEDILKKYPDEFIALNSAGVECMFLNKDKQALDYFNHSVRAAPNNYKSYYNRGLLYLKNNKPKEAVQSFNQTIQLYEYAKAYSGRASAYYMLGDLPKAIEDSKYALTLDGLNSKAHFVLGNCYNDLNKLEDAKRAYNKCIELNKDEADYYFKRAIVLGKLQDFKACLADLEICLNINPAYTEASYWKGVAKVNLKEDPCDDFKKAALQNYEPAVNAYNKYCR